MTMNLVQQALATIVLVTASLFLAACKRGDGCDVTTGCGDKMSCVECSGHNVCFETQALVNLNAYEYACAVYGDGVPIGSDYLGKGGTLKPAPAGSGSGSGGGGGCPTSFDGYAGYSSEAQLMSFCQAAYLYDCPAHQAEHDSSCDTFDSLGAATTSSPPSCIYCP